MLQVRTSPFLSSTLLAVALAACGSDDSPDLVDAPTTVDGSAPDAPVLAPDAPPGPSVLGAWTVNFDGSYFWHVFRYTFTGNDAAGEVVIEHSRVDVNGVYADCAQQDAATGTWTIANGNLDVVVTAGTTSRQTSAIATLDCDEAYAERAMTADELRAVDLADGPMRFEGDTLVTKRDYSETYWERAQ